MKAVTFDFWNTLVRAGDSGPHQLRVSTWQRALADAGLERTDDQVRDAVRRSQVLFEEHWRRNDVYSAAMAVADAATHLEAVISPTFVAELIQVVTDPDPAHDPGLAPNVGEALGGLRDRGIAIGIICDVGLTPSVTLRRYLAKHGILECFSHWSFSDEVGTFKPDPIIFDHALSGLGGISPSDAVHVGDLRRTDIGGAQAKGIFAVRYTGLFDDPGSAAEGTDNVEADAVVADHANLLEALGLG